MKLRLSDNGFVLSNISNKMYCLFLSIEILYHREWHTSSTVLINYIELVWCDTLHYRILTLATKVRNKSSFKIIHILVLRVCFIVYRSVVDELFIKVLRETESHLRKRCSTCTCNNNIIVVVTVLLISVLFNSLYTYLNTLSQFSWLFVSEILFKVKVQGLGILKH